MKSELVPAIQNGDESMIFNLNAPKYWASGLAAHPLIAGQKRPALSGWNVYSDRLPSAEEQALWLQKNAYCNIGIVCGPASGILGLDLDSVDLRARKVVDQFLPKSPYERFGRKGAMFAYRYDGQRTFRVLDEDGNTIIECLSRGAQFVLPPSIHPDTGQPYTSNVPLYEVARSLPSLPNNLETVLREALKAEGFTLSSAGSTRVSVFVPAGARDNAMVSNAGILARAITRGERTLVEALAEMKAWVETYTEKVAGDEVSVEKAQGKVLDFLLRDVIGEKRRGLPEGWDHGLTAEDKEKMGLPFTDVDEQWSVELIADRLKEEFLRFEDPRVAGWGQAVEFALDRIVRSNLTSLQDGLLLKFISDQSKGSYPVASLKKRLNELRRGDMAGDNHKDIAERALKDLSETGEIRFHVTRFWQWKGAAWETLETLPMEGFITKEFGGYPGCRKNADTRGVLNAMKGLAVNDLVQARVEGVNFANGFLTQEMELLPHKPDFGATYVLPYRYMPDNSHCPMFMQFLHDSWGEDFDFQDKMLALQEAFAATILGLATRYQRAFCLFGKPGSGKSRIPVILTGLLPDGCRANVPPSEWRDKFLPAELYGKLLNVAGEMSERRKIAGDIFKLIVEGAPITAQHKNQPPFTFSPRAAQWFCGNYLPMTDDFSGGFSRRWLFLEFNKPVLQENKNEQIAEIIVAQEREQIVAWGLEAVDRLKKNKDYTRPASHRKLVSQMTSKNNSVYHFLSENRRLRIGEKAHEGRQKTSTDILTLHNEFWGFCASTGSGGRVPPPLFATMLDEFSQEFGYSKRPGRAVVYELLTVEDRPWQ